MSAERMQSARAKTFAPEVFSLSTAFAARCTYSAAWNASMSIIVHATDSAYANKVIKLMKQFGVADFDTYAKKVR